MNCYFMQQDGETFKAQVKYAPYFLIATEPDCENDVEAFLRRRYEGKIHDVLIVDKEDLDLKNHLSGLTQRYLKVVFATVQDLMDVRREVMPLVKKNQTKCEAAAAYEALHRMETETSGGLGGSGRAHHGRADDARPGGGGGSGGGEARDRQLRGRHDRHPRVRRAAPRALAHRHRDAVRMVVRRARVGGGDDLDPPTGPARARGGSGVRVRHRDDEAAAEVPRRGARPGVHDLVHARRAGVPHHQPRGRGRGRGGLRVHPKPEYPGPFVVWNEPDEASLLRRWFDHMRETRPCVYVTYNGDFFDWPFVETRAEKLGMSLYDELGFRCDRKTGECRSRSALHLDAFAWVKRDSYLPAGSHGLKAVTKAKLKYNPVEVDAEDMLPFARAAADDGGVLGVGRGEYLLPLHDLRPPVHLLPGDDHPHEPGRGAEERVGDAVRGSADGGGVPREHRVPEQDAKWRGEALQGPPPRVRDVHRRARGGASRRACSERTSRPSSGSTPRDTRA